MNNKIKALLIIGVLALVALTSSCKSDNKAPKGDQLAETYQGKPGTFTIRFSVPSGDPVKYNLRMTQDAREYSIDKVTLYIFENDKLALDPISISNPSLMADPNDPTAMIYTYTSTDNSIPKGLVTIYGIANEELTPQLHKGDNVSQLKDKLAKKEQKANESSKDVVNGDGKAGSTDKIPMVGVKSDVNLFRQEVTLPLERIVARIDIKNNVADNLLNITEVSLHKANSKSLLVDDKTSNVATGSTKVDGVQPFLFTAGAEQKVHNKVFYLYEGNQTSEAEATYVLIKAKFRGTEKEYKVPFYDKKQSKGIDIVRNTLYRIVLGTDHTNDNLTFHLEVADWDGYVNTVVNWDAFSVAFDKASSNDFTYDAKKHELTAPKTAASATFTTSCALQNETPTFTATVEGTHPWLTASVEHDGKIKINVKAAGDAPRGGIVTVKCSTDLQFEYKILVKQDKKDN